jgi:hypothetical protein
MPQSSPELRAKWENDSVALKYLEQRGIREVRNGIFIAPKNRDDWDAIDWSAVQYMVEEWDFAVLPQKEKQP